MREVVAGVLVFTASCIGFSPDGNEPRTDAAVDAPEVLPACTAQRTVHLVGGIGGLGWFTSTWPPPPVITGFQATFAYDSPLLAVDLSNSEPGGRQPLFVRRQTLFGLGPLWQGVGTASQPSAFAVGVNETHTRTPLSAITRDGKSVIAAGAAAQVERLSPPVPVLVFGLAPYQLDSGAPAELRVDTVAEAIDEIAAIASLSDSERLALEPDSEVLKIWVTNANVATSELAERLLFTTNALRAGLVGTVIIPALENDPHGAFADPPTTYTPHADNLVNLLEGFYRELDGATESTCGYRGAPLSLANNVVLVVSGDTPKNSYNNGGWPDGTPGGTNALYVRSNGWLVPGWFGEIAAGAKTNFSPTSGQLDPLASDDSNLAAAINATLYAITRGDGALVNAFDPGEFDAVRSPVAP